MVDDEPDFGVMVGTVGEQPGYEVTVATCTGEIQATFRKDPPEDVVFDMDGMKLIQCLVGENYEDRMVENTSYFPITLRL